MCCRLLRAVCRATERTQLIALRTIAGHVLDASEPVAGGVGRVTLVALLCCSALRSSSSRVPLFRFRTPFSMHLSFLCSSLFSFIPILSYSHIHLPIKLVTIHDPLGGRGGGRVDRGVNRQIGNTFMTLQDRHPLLSRCPSLLLTFLSIFR